MTDGPFAETKELIGGFAIPEVGSQPEAVAWATRFAHMLGDVGIEVRQVVEAADFEHDALEGAARKHVLR